MTTLRCPVCGAVYLNGRTTHRHRPPCPNTDTTPDNWTQEVPK